MGLPVAVRSWSVAAQSKNARGDDRQAHPRLPSPLLGCLRRDFRHFVTAITGGGWVLCEVKALSHGMEGQSNA